MRWKRDVMGYIRARVGVRVAERKYERQESCYGCKYVSLNTNINVTHPRVRAEDRCSRNYPLNTLYPIKRKRLLKSVVVSWKWYAVFLQRIFREVATGRVGSIRKQTRR